MLIGVAFPAAGELFVADGPAVHVYADGARGAAAPLRSLQFAGGFVAIGVAVDLSAGELFVALDCFDCGPILEPARAVADLVVGCQAAVVAFDMGADGPVTPELAKRVICGAATGIESPIGLVVDSTAGELFVVDNVGAVRVFPLAADGDVAPLRTIAGPATGLVSPSYAFLDRQHGELFVATGRIFETAVHVFDRLADGDAAPLRSLTGDATLLGWPHGLAVDLDRDELLVLDGLGWLMAFPRDAAGDTPPLRRANGPTTELAGPFGLSKTPTAAIVANQGSGEVLFFAPLANGDEPPTDRLGGAGSGLLRPIGVASTLAADAGSFAVPGPAPAAAAVEIPALSRIGAVLLALLLAGAGLWIRGRQAATTG